MAVNARSRIVGAIVTSQLEVTRQVGFQTDENGGFMRFGPFLIIAVLLAILWAGSFVMFHVASGLIHLLLLFAVISLVIHLFTGARTA